MTGSCAKCGTVLNGQAICIRCGNVAGADVAAVGHGPLSAGFAGDLADGPSFSRRLLLGAVTVAGLYFGLLHLVWAIALSSSHHGQISVEGSFGLLMGANLIAAFVAGMANRRAEFTGFLLGLTAAACFVVVVMGDGKLPEDKWWIGVAILLVMVGLVGGLAGRLVIPAAPDLPKFGRNEANEAAVAPLRKARMVWWRVPVGAAIVVLGTVYADQISYTLYRVLGSQGGSFGMGRLVTWQISVLAAVLGGVAAGMSTRTGFRQGLAAGILAALTALVLIGRDQSTAALVTEFWMYQLDIDGVNARLVGALSGCIVAATTLGGWLGSQCLPPPGRRSRLLADVPYFQAT